MELLYFANPMCSWCWGFAPVLRALEERHGELRLTVATGRLGVNGERPLREKDKNAIRERWQHVTELTGQPFDHAFFARQRFVYDTAPACRALALLRASYPALASSFLQRLHERFYAHNEDITDPAVLARLAADLGQDARAFEAGLADPQLSEAVEQEWRQTAELGVAGYPMLLALDEGRAHGVAVGYRPLEAVEEALEGISRG